MTSECQEISIELRPSRSLGQASALLVSGLTPKAWLENLIPLVEDIDRCSGFLLPSSRSDLSPCGWLVVGISEVSGLARSRRSGSVQPYTAIGERLWVPQGSRLEPEMEPREVDVLLPYACAVFHPTIGLVGFDESDRVFLSDLLGGWPSSGAHFGYAQEGVELPDRLLAITAKSEPRLEILMEDVGNEIGHEAPEGLPPTPGEGSESGVAHLRKQMKLRFLHALERLSGATRQDPGKEGWRQRLEAWTARRLEALQRNQERELDRLLHLLKSNPDEGLKYALPLGGDQARGTVTPPSDQLAKRDPEFGLPNLSGGQASSPWVVDWERQYALSKQYREAANRELQLGRYRRAAYVFAELLKDYRAAADALCQGKHYREASVLYLKHLGDRLAGAQCLRRGGFFQEAIVIYEKEKQFETVAELYLLLDQKSEAEEAFRMAVSRCLAHGQTAKAALLLEEKLNDREGAIKHLQRAWPKGSDAVTCLQHELSAYARWGDEDSLVERLETVVGNHPPGLALGVLQTLVRWTRESPYPKVSEQARQGGFIVASRWLGGPKSSQREALLEQVRHLVPDDRLLARDTLRFQEQCAHEERQRTRRVSDVVPMDEPVFLLERHPLPHWVDWEIIESQGERGVVGLGRARHGLNLMRMDWEGAYQVQTVPLAGGDREASVSGCVLEATSGALPEMVSVLGLELGEAAVLTQAERFLSPMRVENPQWTRSTDFLGMTYGGKGVAWVLRRQQGSEDGLLVLSSHSSMGDLIATHSLRLPFQISDADLRCPMKLIYARDQIVLLCGHHLVRYYRDRVEGIELEEKAERVCFGESNRLMIAVCDHTGVEVIWGDEQWGRRERVPISNPGDFVRVAFTRTGDLLMASEGRLDVYALGRDGYRFLHSHAFEGVAAPLGLFPTDVPNRYALVTRLEMLLLRVDTRSRN